MTLTTHAVIGAAVVSFFPEQPTLGLAAALLSHYLGDRIPHWDMRLNSLEQNKQNHLDTDFVFGRKTVVDLLKIGFDFGLGLILVYLFFYRSYPELGLLVFGGALMGMLPDFLQFLYFKLRFWPLLQLQKLHHFAHSPYRLDDKPILGISLQVLLILATVLTVYYS